MEHNEDRSIKRCYNIVTEYGGLDEFIKRIEESLNESYTKEQCYKDILENAEFNTSTIIEFIKHTIFSQNKEDIEIIAKNINMIRPEIFSYLIEELQKDDKCKEFLKNEIKNGLVKNQNTNKNYAIFKFLKSEEDGNQIIEEIFEDFLSNGYDFKLVSKIIEETKIPETKLIENKAKILENAKGENIISFINWFNQRGHINDDDIKLEDFVRALHSDVEDNKTLKVLEVIYEELTRKQGISVKDIELLGKGASNTNYKIGEFVLKVGGLRQTKEIPSHKKILKPIIRQEANHDIDNSLFIEIQNLVDDKWYKNMSDEQIEEEIYKIYKELRDSKIVWTDIKKENVGRLINKNTSNDNKLAELVILDTDYIFNESEINFEEEFKQRPPAKFIRYEQRYIYEKEDRDK